MRKEVGAGGRFEIFLDSARTISVWKRPSLVILICMDIFRDV